MLQSQGSCPPTSEGTGHPTLPTTAVFCHVPKGNQAQRARNNRLFPNRLQLGSCSNYSLVAPAAASTKKPTMLHLRHKVSSNPTHVWLHCPAQLVAVRCRSRLQRRISLRDPIPGTTQLCAGHPTSGRARSRAARPPSLSHRGEKQIRGVLWSRRLGGVYMILRYQRPVS